MRLIDADELKKAIIKHLCVKSENNLLQAEKSIYNCIDEQQTIELLKAQQPKKGHWVMKHRHSKSVKYVTGIDKWGEEHEIQFVEESEGNEPYCSECGAAAAESFLCFCPKCGADMRESLEKDGEQE